MKRYGSVIGLNARKRKEYRELHAAVWPAVLRRIQASHIRNYSIFLRKMPDGRFYLFSYYEYTGRNYERDMARIAADPVTRKWWELCIPCQVPLADRAKGEWWAGMEEVFHQD